MKVGNRCTAVVVPQEYDQPSALSLHFECGVATATVVVCIRDEAQASDSMTSRMWKLDKDLVHVFDDKEFKVYMRAVLSGARGCDSGSPGASM